MKLVSRSALGWPPSAAPIQSTTRGVKIHYLGTSFKASSHSDCTVHVKQVRASHLANTAENYSDIAYNFLVCKHGYVYEGRGYGKRTGANGNQDLNRAHYAVCALLGSSGDTEPTDEMAQAIREVVYGLREHGAGNEIKGHRDGYATSCPGDALYALVKSGKLEPLKEDEDDMPSAEEVAKAVWAFGIKNRFRKNAATSAGTFLEYGDSHYDEIMKRLTALDAKMAEIFKKLS